MAPRAFTFYWIGKRSLGILRHSESCIISVICIQNTVESSVVSWERVRLSVYDLQVRDTYWYPFFSENVSDPVIKSFRNIWNLEV